MSRHVHLYFKLSLMNCTILKGMNSKLRWCWFARELFSYLVFGLWTSVRMIYYKFIFLFNYSSQTDAELKKVLELFETKGRYDYWSEQISTLTLVSCGSSDNTQLPDTALNFLRSWRSFLIVLAEPEVRTVEKRNKKSLKSWSIYWRHFRGNIWVFWSFLEILSSFSSSRNRIHFSLLAVSRAFRMIWSRRQS